MSFKVDYVKKSNGYVVNYGNISFFIPLRYHFGDYSYFDVTDGFMDDFVDKLRSGDCPILFDGVVIDKMELEDLIKNTMVDNKNINIVIKSKEYLECPYCLEYGLRLYNYGDGHDVYECDLCGAEIWYWQERGIEVTCQEIKEDNMHKGG